LRKYETIFVIDSLLKSEEIDNIINKYERFISANGGNIGDVEHWGKKRLAYEIKKRQYGYYVLIRFDGPPTMIKTLEREYRLNESLLRFKTLVMENASIEATKTEKTSEPKKVETAVETETVPDPQEETAVEETADPADVDTEETTAAELPEVEDEDSDIDAEEDESQKEE